MASPSEFFDPFAAAASLAPSFPSPRHGIDGVDGGLKELVPIYSQELLILGQGTISVKSSAKDTLRFSISTKAGTQGGRTLHLDVGKDQIRLYFNGSTGEQPIDYHPVHSSESPLLNPGLLTTYWLSIDSNNGILRYGKYFTNKTMTLIEAPLKHLDKDGRMIWTDPTKYSWLQDVFSVHALEDGSKSLDTLIQPLPVVIDMSPFVLSADQITLDDLDAGIYLLPANLPGACQNLYGNVGGSKLLLDDSGFPDFSKAIQRSCTTEGLWAYNKLKSKAGEFDGDEETYLRITLGYNLGDSPGIPYVLEIWPSGHSSPIHDHGNACAVIKVLHGEITCTWYDTLGTATRPPALIGPPGKLREGQITWIGEQNYQIHKLHNLSDDVCCTIQCYRYDDQDNVHYDGFNWRDPTGKIEKFIPNSDMAFLDFKRIIKKEWDERNVTNGSA